MPVFCITQITLYNKPPEKIQQHTMTTKRKPRSKQADLKTSLAFRAKRLSLSMQDVQKLTKEQYGSVLNWKQGRSRCPRSVLRLLAVYRLAHWGKF